MVRAFLRRQIFHDLIFDLQSLKPRDAQISFTTFVSLALAQFHKVVYLEITALPTSRHTKSHFVDGHESNTQVRPATVALFSSERDVATNLR